MKVNPFKLKKAELQIYLSKYCKHRMPYQAHPSCFVKEILEGGKGERIGILDIETSNFKANYGYILTYAIKEHNEKKIYSQMVSPTSIRKFELDKTLMKNLVKDINKFDKIVTFYGTKFDIPYIRSRSLKNKIKFPFYGFVQHKDLYYIIKYKFKFQSSSLDSACRFFNIVGKNHIDPDAWIRASCGSKKDLQKVLAHNIQDVKITDRLYDTVINYSRKSHRSL